MPRLAVLLCSTAVLLSACTNDSNPLAPATTSTANAKFPEIPSDGLDPTQQKIIDITKQEFLAQPAGTKYSEGTDEAWCANFISWVYNEAGTPLENPNSGSWRIPGTFTLQEYYESNGRFHPADSGYTPQPGDVAIYQGSPIFGDHANIVLSSNNGAVTTVGGNEEGRIRIYENTEQNYEGLIGYGARQ